MKKIVMAGLVSLGLSTGTAFAQDVVLVNNSISIDNSQGYPRIVGEAVNNSNQVVDSVIVSFNLYDQQDRQVGNALANVSNVEPGSRIRFSALPNTQDFGHAKFTKITTH